MQTVGQGEVDYSKLAAEGDCWFSAFIGQWTQPGAMAACQYDTKSLFQNIFDHLATPYTYVLKK